ncbi:hypothetical protein GGD38_006442 [Chitinophagaceae bacterium OAS944]|nr:hypothetical protein [Chitinophagaceae bacterium OAS944]
MTLLQIEIGIIRDALRQSFYPVLIMILLNLVFLILAVRFKRRCRLFQVLIVYAVITLLNDFHGLLQPILNPPKHKGINVTVGPYLLAEFVLFYVLFYLHFKQKRIQHIIMYTTFTFGAFFVAATAYYFFYGATRVQVRLFEGYWSASSSLLQIVATIYYYYTILTEPPLENLTRESHFWIFTGIFCVQSINIPLFLIETYLHNTFPSIFYYLYSINYIAYSFLFLLLILSVVCNIRFSKSSASTRIVANQQK